MKREATLKDFKLIYVVVVVQHITTNIVKRQPTNWKNYCSAFN